MQRQGVPSKMALTVLLWGLFFTALVRTEDRGHFAEELVRELKELELAVERKEMTTDTPATTSPAPEKTTGAAENPETTIDAASVVDEFEENIEDATDEMEEDMVEIVEEENEKMDEAVNNIEKQLEEGNFGSQVKNRKKGNSKGRNRGGNSGKRRMTDEKRAESLQAREQRQLERQRERLVRFLQEFVNRLARDNLDEDLLNLTRYFLEQVRSLAGDITMATDTTTLSNMEGAPSGDTTTTMEGEMTPASTTPTPTTGSDVGPQLRRLLRMLAHGQP